jgi:hypothetical protein
MSMTDVMLFVDAFNNECAHVLSKCRVVNAPRRKHIEAALKDADLETWKKAFKALAASEFHTGKNERKWRANIDFILRPAQRAVWIENGFEHEHHQEHVRMKREEAQEQYVGVVAELAKSKTITPKDTKPCTGCAKVIAHSSAKGGEPWVCWNCNRKRKSPRQP